MEVVERWMRARKEGDLGVLIELMNEKVVFGVPEAQQGSQSPQSVLATPLDDYGEWRPWALHSVSPTGRRKTFERLGSRFQDGVPAEVIHTIVLQRFPCDNDRWYVVLDVTEESCGAPCVTSPASCHSSSEPANNTDGFLRFTCLT